MESNTIKVICGLHGEQKVHAFSLDVLPKYCFEIQLKCGCCFGVRPLDFELEFSHHEEIQRESRFKQLDLNRCLKIASERAQQKP